MQRFKLKLKKDKDTAGFVDYITPRGSQFFGPVAHPVWCAAENVVVPVGSAMDHPRLLLIAHQHTVASRPVTVVGPT